MKNLLKIYQEHKGKVSDKWEIYLSEYDRLFSKYRERPVNLLEIGVQNGGSLDIWGRYFECANAIIGCDINQDCEKLVYSDSRVSLVVGDANDGEIEKRILACAGQFDLVIDDGSHKSSDIIRSFARYFKNLSDDGLYIVEDLHCSYWKDFEGGLYDPYSSISFFKQLTDVVNYEHWGVEGGPGNVLAVFFTHFGFTIERETLACIHSIEFINSMCVIRKSPAKRNLLGRRYIVGDREVVFPIKRSVPSDSERATLSQANNPFSRLHPVKEIEQQRIQIGTQDLKIQRLTKQISARERQANEYRQSVDSLSEKIDGLTTEMDVLRNSRSWQITAPLRWVAGELRGEDQTLVAMKASIDRAGGVRRLVEKAWNIYRRDGISGLREKYQSARGISMKGKVAGEKGDTAVVYRQLLDVAGKDSEKYLPDTPYHLNTSVRLRAIAFYLPQFHPFEENDAWWGRGFTEWTNVSKAVPQFEGHEQPRLPGELGFYDLRLSTVQTRQIELARQYGVTAFCFHYYWFTGRKRLLHRPFEQFLHEFDFPFCLCWANENWTRRWDGQEADILMEQRHEPQDDLEFIEDVAPLLRDPRYVRVDGKPLLVVYRVTLLPDPQRTMRIWREYCRSHGVGEIHLVAAQSFGIADPRPYGLDAAVEFPPHGLNVPIVNAQARIVNPDFTGKIYDYPSVVDSQLARPLPNYLLYRTVFPSWDNEARKPGRGHVFTHACPDEYRRWLAGVCDQADRRLNSDEKIVFINAWNEWAEGAYLEPDRRYGYAWLRATQQVLGQYPADAVAAPDLVDRRLALAARSHDTAIVLHLYYPELWPEFVQALRPLLNQVDLYITIPDDRPESDYISVLATADRALLLPFENRGRDIAPFLYVMRALQRLGYRQVLKLHTKKTLHRSDGERWRHDFLEELVGRNGSRAKTIMQALADDPTLGLIGPAGHWLAYGRYWGYPAGRPAQLQALAKRLGLSMSLEDLCFFAGSMFWCRPEALGVMARTVALSDYDPELGQRDGTLAHSLERLMAAACQQAGLRVADTHDLRAFPRLVLDYPYAQASPPLNRYIALPEN